MSCTQCRVIFYVARLVTNEGIRLLGFFPGLPNTSNFTGLAGMVRKLSRTFYLHYVTFRLYVVISGELILEKILVPPDK